MPESASKAIDKRIKALPAWQGDLLGRIRRLIKTAEPDVIEEMKWAKASNAMTGVPVWSYEGIICTGETYKDKVKLTFAKGASLPDPARLFNSSLDGNVRRAIDFFEGDKVNERAFTTLVRAAASLNESSRAGKAKPKATPSKAKAKTPARATTKKKASASNKRPATKKRSTATARKRR